MPRNSIAGQIVDWETLLAKVRSSVSELPLFDAHMQSLELILTEAKEVTVRVETTRGLKQQESQQRREVMKRGKDLAARLRAALKSHYGLQNERLVEFGVRPVRSRSRARATKKPAPQPPAPVPSTPAETE